MARRRDASPRRSRPVAGAVCAADATPVCVDAAAATGRNKKSLTSAGVSGLRFFRSAEPAGAEGSRLDDIVRRSARRVCKSTGWALAFVACAATLRSGAVFAAQRFQADQWITECGSGGDCSITVPFWQTGYSGKGSFALVVMLQTGNIGLVGSPPPLRASLRVDKYPAAVCRGARYCIFPTAQSLAVIRQLAAGSLVLIDVYTARAQFHFSLSPKGYQAGLAQVRAWGYRLAAE